MRFLVTLGRFARSPSGVVTLVLAAILGALFGWGSRFGVTGQRRLMVVVVLLAVSFLIVMLLGMRSRRQSRQVEQSMVREADTAVAAAAAEEKRAREAARQELLAAIAALRRTRVAGGLRGDSALYVLPWYMILGVDGAGKSSLIRGSGLQVPGQAPGELKGIGASQNFEWWFTSQAVILEADSRFVAPDKSESGDRAWRAALQQLRKHRPDLPLNGILVTVPASDLLDPTAGALEAKAKLLRRRLEALIRELDLICPVYLVVTKADLLHGFSEFFADLRGIARDQIWGATLTTPLMMSGDPGAAVEQEFQHLVKRLLRRRLPRLVRAEEQETRGKVYLFPLEFASLRKPLRRLAHILAGPDPQAPTPLLRGFYFGTSGAGGGTTVESVLSEVSRVIGLPGFEAPGSARPVGRGAPPIGMPTGPGAWAPSVGAPRAADVGGWAAASRAADAVAGGPPLFLKTFFLQVLIPDHQIAQPTAGAARRQLIWRWIGRGAAFAGLALLAVLMLVSFDRNRSLVGATVDAVGRANQVRLVYDGPDRLAQRLGELNELRQRLVEFERWPGLADFGLAQVRGKAVAERARRVYLKQLTEVLLRPSHEALRDDLNSTAATWESDFTQFFDRYAAYRVLARPTQEDSTAITPQLRRLWPQRSDLVAAHVQLAWRYQADLERFTEDFHGDESLIDNANRTIRKHHDNSTFLEQVLDEINARQDLDSVTLTSLFPNDVSLRYAGAPVQVDRAFTLKGWKEGVLPRIRSGEVVGRHEWLLREARVSQMRDLDALIAQYAKDYLSAWSTFLASITMNRTNNLNDYSSRLRELAKPNSALTALMEAARNNLDLNKDVSDLGGDRAVPLKQMATQANILNRLLVKSGDGEEKKRPLDQIRENYEVVAKRILARDNASAEEAIESAQSYIEESCLPSPEESPKFNGSLKRLLASLVAEAQSTQELAALEALNEEWMSVVYQRYRSLSDSYPLGSGPDVPLGNFEVFFRPGGTLDSFVRERLSAYVTPDGILKQGSIMSQELAGAIKKANDIRLAMFDQGSGRLRVEVNIRLHQIEVSEGTAPNARMDRYVKLCNATIQGEEAEPRFHRIVWPCEEGDADAGVGVNVRNQPSPSPRVIPSGSWSLFRLLRSGDRHEVDDRTFEYSWRLEGSDYALRVTITLRTDYVPNPFSTNFFSGFSLPVSLD